MNDQINNILYFATDGDSVGKRHASALLDDNLEEISNISEAITEANVMIAHFFESNGGRKISFGGDEGLFEAPESVLPMLEDLRKDYEYMIGATLSIGYGRKPSEAAKALLAAKEWGKNRVVRYDDQAERVALAVQEGRDQKSDSKINEPADCEPPVNDNNHGYDSGYNSEDMTQRDMSYRDNALSPPSVKKPNLQQQMPVNQAISADVQEGGRPMNRDLPSETTMKPKLGKPGKKLYDGPSDGTAIEPEIDAMTHQIVPRDNQAERNSLEEQDAEGNAELFSTDGQEATSDAQEDEIANDMDSERHCPSCTCGAHEDQDDEDIDQLLEEHLNNAKDYGDSIGSGGKDSIDENSVENLMDQHIENGKNYMDENGISRPEDFDEKDEDMGLSEEDADGEPSLSDILREGLDDHADSIHKEKVVQMVGEALDKFKSQKAILDKSKEQAPGFHDACLSMLRAMIELCSLAGIDQSEQEVEEIEDGSKLQDQGEEEDQSAPEQSEEQVPAQEPADSKEESAKSPQP